MRVMKGIKLLFMLALALGVKRTYARHQPSSFRVLTGSEARDQELGQNPELQDIAAQTGERVIINITGDDSLAVVQEGVNALLDCFPFLSMFPGGQVTWLLQRIDELGNPIGVQTQNLPPLSVVKGPNNRYLNIARTNIVQGTDSGIYTCRVCNDQDGVCHNASTTLYLLGEPPNIDCGTPNEDPTAWWWYYTFKIGTNFCLTFDTSAYTTLKCDIIQRNLHANIPGAFPQPERTWEKDEVTYYSATPWAYPVITPEFLTTNPLLQGLMSNALTARTSGSLVFDSPFTLGNNSLVMFPPGTTSASAKRMIFESLLGTWTCSVNNSLGNESCSSTIRECGPPPVLPKCSGPLFLGSNETVNVGCPVFIPKGKYVNLDCSVLSGNTPELTYGWKRNNVSVSTARVLQVRIEGNYTCMVENLDGKESATTVVQYRPSGFRILTGSEARDQELGQNPELQDIAARTGERVIINITGDDSLAVVQEGVNTLLDCFPFLSMFPGGLVTWFLQRIDELGNPIGVQTQILPPLRRIVVEGPNNRYLNITRTNIVQGTDSGIYTCRVCNDQGGVCHNASTTLYLLGEPPNINCGTPNEDPVVSNPPAAVYKIGTNFCLEFGSTSPARTRATLDCDIIQRNLPTNIPGAFPQPERTWEKDGVTYYSATLENTPVITPEFMTKNSLMMQGLTTPDVLEASVDGSLVFNSQFTLKNTSLVMFPPGTTSASAKRMIFESLLGTWTCSVNNSLGNESCSSTIRKCGPPPVLPKCSGPLFLGSNETVNVGCPVFIPKGKHVNLDCGVLSGNTPELTYGWKRNNVSVSTARVLQVRTEGNYTCMVENLDGKESATTIVTTLCECATTRERRDIYNPTPIWPS